MANEKKSVSSNNVFQIKNNTSGSKFTKVNYSDVYKAKSETKYKKPLIQ